MNYFYIYKQLIQSRLYLALTVLSMLPLKYLVCFFIKKSKTKFPVEPHLPTKYLSHNHLHFIIKLHVSYNLLQCFIQ